MKRILFCSAVPLDTRLGMGKHCLELADSFRGLGWEAHSVGPDEIAGRPMHATPETFPPLLRDYLRRTSADYDVVEYDHAYLPYPRSDFPSSTLFVARCMLLHHHFLETAIPIAPGLRPWLGHALRSRQRRKRLEWLVSQADATVREADLTVVSNDRDAAALIRNGANPDRIAILPPGLTVGRFRELSTVPDAVPGRTVVGFIGTFDPRKGMREFPELVDRVAQKIPGVTFRLLGTRGMVRNADGVRHLFPRRLRSCLDIRLTYDPAELPDLLKGVSVGVFPSWVESFGYGVLEMLAAAVPVVAYDAPGPHILLDPEYRVPVGAIHDMADRVASLLEDPYYLLAARRAARERAREYAWEVIARLMAERYETALIFSRTCRL